MSRWGGGFGRGIRFQPASGSSSGGGAAIPPPPSIQANVVKPKGFASLTAINQGASSVPAVADPFTAAVKRRNRTEEQYFDEDEEEPLAYIPGPNSPSRKDRRVNDSDDDDPLDAFMAGIENQVKKEAEAPKKEIEKPELKGIRDDIEGEDDEETYYRYVAENPNFGKDEESDNDLEYDEDGNPIAPKKSKYIDPLPPIDHSLIEYAPFEKNFYEEHPDIEKLTDQQVEELRGTLGIKVSGAAVPKPVSSFGHLGLPEALMKAIRKSEFTQPTPIQSQGIPIILAGRDIIGIAKTGSGKTAAYLWPMMVQIADQRELQPGDGPIGLILCPTRELAIQIYSEAKKFGKVFNFNVCCCYGGGSKWEQSKALEAGAEIVVATPGRMIDLIKLKATNLERVTYLVLDEADRMFDMGFEAQVRSICAHVRPERHCMLFSATMRKKVEKLARVALSDPIRVVQGDIGEANQDVTQTVFLLPLGGAKWNWLTNYLVEFTAAGSVLIFVTKKANAEELHNNLKLREFEALLLHGDMDQTERNKVILSFRKKECDILVATDVAARGLDIPHIKTVVNFDIARDIDTHTHRIGRTGRAGEKGAAFTLITEKDKEFAGHLVRNLEGAGQPVPDNLLDLAMKTPWFRKSRFKEGKGKKASLVGRCRGLGYEDSKSNVSSTSTYNTMPTFKPGLVTGGLAASSAESAGPGSSRLDAMRSAFKQQYMSQFKRSDDTPVDSTAQGGIKLPSSMPPPSDIPPPPSNSSEETDDSENPRKKRRSRWD
ncbi:ATP-dependent RNA helicase DDX42 [Orchesella cincta]|uniref:ATP-dependent RNA helicase DDX42 n=1 Tax=Orchesella cincta TaxID=48709 RepID=A0A1D2NKU8_ORCCI|nr:ATP-dependent RNA helicase DDX42 [Orchesella cincta]